MWTSQGLNLGPPDYESVKIKFFVVSQNFSWLCKSLFHNYFVTLLRKSEISINLN